MRKMILSGLLYRLYTFERPRLRKIVLGLVSRLEGGQMHSKTLRKIFSDYHSIKIGMYSYGGCFNPYNIRAYTNIGRYCSFAENVYIFNANHPLACKSTHPFFYKTSLGYVEDEQLLRRSIEIGSDVWIGQNAVILASVKKIGDGAIIGAGSIVTKDVPDFAVVVGNPAKIVKYRFTEQTIAKIKQEKWWEKDIEDLKYCLDSFQHPIEKVNHSTSTLDTCS